MNRRLAIASLFVALAATQAACAAAFAVSPIRIDLDRGTRTGLVNIASEDERRIYFQLKLYEWTQTPTGEDHYAESTDLIFFPQILTVEPNDRRIVRIGLRSPPQAPEKAYRLFIEEMPDPNEPPSSGARVAVRLRFGVPIFVAGSEAKPRIEITRVEGAKGVLAVEVRNTGERQFRIEEITALAADKVAAQAAGWYVFPGVTRLFQVPFGAGRCPTARFVVKAVGEGQEIRKEVDGSAAMCQP